MASWRVGSRLSMGFLQGAVAMLVILVIYQFMQAGLHLVTSHHPGAAGSSPAVDAELHRLRAENRMLRERLERLAVAAGVAEPPAPPPPQTTSAAAQEPPQQGAPKAQGKPQKGAGKKGGKKSKQPKPQPLPAPAPPPELPRVPEQEPIPEADLPEFAEKFAEERPPDDFRPDDELPGKPEELPAMTCKADGLAFEPGDESSREVLQGAGWELSAASKGPFKGFDSRKAVQLRFRDRGVARLGVVIPAGVAMSLGGIEIIRGRQSGDSCVVRVAYAPGDILKISGGAGSADRAFRLDSFELLAQSVCAAARPAVVDASRAAADPKSVAAAEAAKGICHAWQRVRLPWSDCLIEGQARSVASREPWIEGRVSKVLNETHALVTVPAPARPGPPPFDPTSPLTSYQDDGNCGARGDDAEADTSSCPDGVELVKSEKMNNYKIVAKIKGCGYFAYKIFKCKGDTSGPVNTRLVLPARLLIPVADEAPEEVAIASVAAVPHCSGFKDEGKRIVIMVLGDKKFQAKYGGQIASLRCFTDAHGYGFEVLEGNEYRVCKQYTDYFFRKHCTVAEWLETQPADLVLAIVDADVVAVVLERGLEKWAHHDADVQVYQRCLFPEIMAGNYMVRNSVFSRTFLRNWAHYNHEKPPGFSSSDNGAIHLVVQETVKAVDFQKCKKMYKALRSSVNDLTEYFKFVTCVTGALGPPRDWHSSGGILTVWPRLNFWATDGVYMVKAGAVEVGPVLHHGMKDPKHVTEHYYKNVTACKRNMELALQPAEALGKHALEVARGYKEYFPQGRDCKETALRQCPERCMRRFACWPLRDRERPLPNRTCSNDCG